MTPSDDSPDALRRQLEALGRRWLALTEQVGRGCGNDQVREERQQVECQRAAIQDALRSRRS